MRDNRETRARFAAAIQEVSLIAGRKEKPDKVILGSYWHALSPFSIETIEAVAKRLIATESPMYTLPVPGRWAEVADQIRDSLPQKSLPLGKHGCPACEGTGFRAVIRADGVRAVTTCECRRGLIPPDGITPSLLQAPLKVSTEPVVLDDEIPPQPGEHELQRRRREWGNRIFHCACCGQPYRQRIGWRCCNAPGGMKRSVWSQQWHVDCDGPGRHRCPTHCPHPPEERVRRLPEPSPVSPVAVPMPEDGEHIDGWAKRTGLRAAEAPAPGDPPPTEVEETDPAAALGDSEWPEDF